MTTATLGGPQLWISSPPAPDSRQSLRRATYPQLLHHDLGHGRTIIFTGATAALRGSAGFANLAVPKFGLRALAQSMARELGPEGVHIGFVIIDGQIESERYRNLIDVRGEDSLLAPDAIAELYLQLHRQPRSAWSHEIDVRPWSEKF